MITISQFKSLIILLLMVSLELKGSHGAAQVPCLFIFGDSLSDSGNNNPLLSWAKCNYLPYGIDFPGGATGRFCNGRTTIDLVGDHLGLPNYIQPYANKTNKLYHEGVNYASGSAGIKKETGLQVGQRICMDVQLQRHKEIIAKINKDMGAKATGHLKQCIYNIYVGSNDWMLNFFSGGSVIYLLNPISFGNSLIKDLTKQITTLYGMGARKVVVFGLGPLGCLPPITPLGICSPFANAVIEVWNNSLKTMVKQFNAKYKDARFIWINSVKIITPDLKGLGLRVRTNSCCMVVGASCVPLSIPCPNRKDHAYWDFAHPTEAANKVLAARAYKNQVATDTYPMDISALAALKL
ncbi:GDSL esterase/lipase At1g29670-like [Silene latifolia]|uniref:GDSL esterase/lipase At1g29670-like n=1 Tax=Silene latifolia TaxID=37657 RepID=UPI003D77284E